jgi:four helix bundle protein
VRGVRGREICRVEPASSVQPLRTSSHGVRKSPAFSIGISGALNANMAGVRDFRGLVCWQLSRELKLAIYEFLERPHVRRDFKFCDHLRDAARSAPRNIAEGFGRRSHADFARFLDVTRGSLAEWRNHLHDARDLGYLDEPELKNLDALASRATGAVAALQRYLRG